MSRCPTSTAHSVSARAPILPLPVAGTKPASVLPADFRTECVSHHPSVLGRWKHPGKSSKLHRPRRRRYQLLRHFRQRIGQRHLFRCRAVLPRRLETPSKRHSKLRFSFRDQNNFGDHADFAPRLGLAWGIGGNGKNPPKTVLRAGSGMFYDRFSYDLFLQQERLNGATQQQFLVTNPQFYLFNIPATLPQSNPTKYVSNPNLRAPYTIQTGISLERQLTKSANLSVTYLTSRGVHQFFTTNLNPADPITGARKNGSDNIFQYQSEGIFKQNQLIVNSSIRMGTKISLFGYYTFSHANSDISGPGGFPSNPFDVSQDYGRASFDIRHRVFFGEPWACLTRFESARSSSRNPAFRSISPRDRISTRIPSSIRARRSAPVVLPASNPLPTVALI